MSFDITHRVTAERQLLQIKRLYATLSQVNQTIVRVKDPAELYQTICDVAVEFGKFSLAWIGLLDEASGDIRPVAACELDVPHWPFPAINVRHGELKDVFPAVAIRTAEVVTSEDVLTDERTQILRDQIEQLNFHSLAAVPFRLKGDTVGVLNLVSREEGLFSDDEELRLLEEMGLDISFALETMDTEGKKRQLEERYRRTLDDMLEGCQIIDFDWRYVYVNDAVARHGKRAKHELLDHTMMEMYPGIENTELFAVLRDCMENRVARQLENEFTYPDGSVGWFDLSIQPAPEGIFILSVDVTERKRAEDALLAGDHQMRALVTSLDDIVFEFDEGGTYLNVWTADESLLAQPKDQLLGHRLVDVLGEEISQPFTEALKRVFESGQPEKIEYPLEVIGGERWFMARLNPIQDEDESCRNRLDAHSRYHRAQAGRAADPAAAALAERAAGDRPRHQLQPGHAPVAGRPAG